jgi:ATP-dependent RNA helicase RhlE
MTQFSELPLSPYIQARLAAAQFTIPTPVQQETIPAALAGSDIFATAQTGTGKTLAFLVPVMEQLLNTPAKGVTTLILVPTRELAMQVAAEYDALRGAKLPPAALVMGGSDERKQIQQLRRARVVVATPGRLEDFLDRNLVSLSAVRTLVLDEADRMFDMGFLPAVRRIAGLLPRKRQTLCFSATLMPSVVEVVKEYMNKPLRISVDSITKPCSNVKVQAIEVSRANKQATLQRLLENADGRCLVFTRTKRGSERLARDLAREGFAAARIHGNRSQPQRIAALRGFQDGEFQVLVATDVAARGLHVDDIAHVINYDLPQIAEDFVHRVGRTGRAGASGLASTLYEGYQALELRELERALGISLERTSAPENNPASPRKSLAESLQESSGRGSGRSSLTPLPGEFLQHAGTTMASSVQSEDRTIRRQRSLVP